MEKIRAAVVGYGNIGRYVVETLRVSPDFEIAGIIRRNGSENCPDEIKDLKVVKDVKELGKVDVAILCTPTRKVEEHAIPLLEMGINTVDSFDIHTNIVELRRSLDAAAKKHGAVSVISAGWDPGSDSVVRALLEAIAPKGITYTNFGPGMSMGHTVAVKAIDGVTWRESDQKGSIGTDTEPAVRIRHEDKQPCADSPGNGMLRTRLVQAEERLLYTHRNPCHRPPAWRQGRLDTQTRLRRYN